MIRKLDRYVFRVFATSLCAALLLAAGLFVLTDLFNSADNFMAAGAKLKAAGARDLARHVFALAVRFYAIEVSIRLLQFTPFVTFFAAVFTASRLHRTNETVAMRASGVSLQRGFAAVFAGAFLLTCCQVVFRECFLPRFASESTELRANLLFGKPRFEVDGVFVVDRDGNRYRLGSYRPGSELAFDVRMDATFEKEFWSVTAKSARFERTPGGRGAWRLEGGKLVKMPRAGSASSITTTIDVLPDAFRLTPEDCELATRANLDPLYLSISELDTLARRLPSVAKFQVLFHAAVTAVLANLLLPLLGLPCVLRADRRSALEGSVLAFGLCVLYFAATLLCFQLGSSQVLGPVFAAWLPTVVLGSLGVTFFESMRT